jgi:hypothetical protein
VNTNTHVAKIYVKYPKGLYFLVEQIRPKLYNLHPNCYLVSHKLTDKRGVHSTVVSICIICKPSIFCRICQHQVVGELSAIQNVEVQIQKASIRKKIKRR